MIHSVFGLAEEVSATRDGSEGDGADVVGRSIAHRLFKDTSCGVSFWSQPTKVVITGYCEGSDHYIEGRELCFPFTADQFWAAVNAADRDGCDVWDATHGCNDCGEPDEFGDIACNPQCRTCGGEGMVL
jgi:hypothetical protein